MVVEVWAWLHFLHDHPNVSRRFPTVEHRGKLTCSEHGLYHSIPSDKEVCAEVLLHCVSASDEVGSVAALHCLMCMLDLFFTSSLSRTVWPHPSVGQCMTFFRDNCGQS